MLASAPSASVAALLPPEFALATEEVPRDFVDVPSGHHPVLLEFNQQRRCSAVFLLPSPPVSEFKLEVPFVRHLASGVVGLAKPSILLPWRLHAALTRWMFAAPAAAAESLSVSLPSPDAGDAGPFQVSASAAAPTRGLRSASVNVTRGGGWVEAAAVIDVAAAFEVANAEPWFAAAAGGSAGVRCGHTAYGMERVRAVEALAEVEVVGVQGWGRLRVVAAMEVDTTMGMSLPGECPDA